MTKHRSLFFKYGLIPAVVLFGAIIIFQYSGLLGEFNSYFTLAISLLAAGISFFSCMIADESHHSSLRPILVFVYKNDENQKRWMIENVGNGPALNVTIYRGDLKDTWLEGKNSIQYQQEHVLSVLFK